MAMPNDSANIRLRFHEGVAMARKQIASESKLKKGNASLLLIHKKPGGKATQANPTAGQTVQSAPTGQPAPTAQPVPTAQTVPAGQNGQSGK